MAETIKLAEYLFTRLHQLGIRSMFGVPGDYNLTLLDYVEPSGIRWVGNCNELNTGYAADGYSRIKGIGAMITTFGVGELSAINAITGAYAERAPVVHIVGTPERKLQENRINVHHTLLDGDYWKFAQMAKYVTAAQTDLKDPRTGPEQIDVILEQCLIHSRPVYISIPTDMVTALVSSSRLKTALSIPSTVEPANEDTALSQILERIHSCKRPLILVDGESRGFGIVKELEELIKATNWPTWTSLFGKSLVDETLPNVHGVYASYDGKPEYKRYFDSSDLVLCFGPHHSNTNSFLYTAIPKPENTIAFLGTSVRIGNETFRDLPSKYLLSKLLQSIDKSKLQTPDLPSELSSVNGTTASDPQLYASESVRHKEIWGRISEFFREGDVILAETGTAGVGARAFKLPRNSRIFLPSTWLSIGYMLPATLGAAIAQRDLAASGEWYGLKEPRTVLFIGDGSLQMTVQELSTIIHQKLNVIVFVINNDGYTIERCIHGRNQRYNDVVMWRYLQAPHMFGADEKETHTSKVETWGDLDQVLGDERMQQGKSLRMVEIMMEREDAPTFILDLLNQQKEREKTGGRTSTA